MFCSSCGTSLRLYARFCAVCGLPTDSPAVPALPITPSVANRNSPIAITHPASYVSPQRQQPAMYAAPQGYAQAPVNYGWFGPTMPAQSSFAYPDYFQQSTPAVYPPLVSNRLYPSVRPGPVQAQQAISSLPVVNYQAPASGKNQVQLTYPSFGPRAAAFLVDMILILLFVTLALVSLSGILSAANEEAVTVVLALLVTFVALIFLLWYPVVQPASTGQTLGKRLFNIKVVDRSGNPPGVAKMAARFFIGYPLSALIMGVGFLVPLWDIQRQALDDKLVDTYVINA